MKSLILLIIFLVATSFSFAAIPELKALQAESKKINWDNSVSRSVIMDASLEEVWKYASDSTKAIDWSVYFHHISPLPGKYPDGTIGSLRRCFRNKDESGQRWDEITIGATPLASREIVTYNFHDYGFEFITDSSYVFVRQLYKSLGPNKTELTFQTITPPRFVPLQWIAFKLVAGETSEIFGKNLENIKMAIEGKERLYPWKQN